MYGHVCETGGTKEVLSPRPLNRFTFKDLLESQDGVTDNKQDEGPRAALDSTARRPTQRKIVGATIRVRLATHIIDSSKG